MRRDKQASGQYFALRTFRSDGTGVVTPVWLAESDGRFYLWTPGKSWKMRRLRRRAAVEFAPSDFDGHPTGTWRSGTARELSGRDRIHARKVLTSKYRWQFRLFLVIAVIISPRSGTPTAVEIIPSEGERPQR